VLVRGTPANMLLRATLALAVGASVVSTFTGFLRSYPIAVDLQIPLRAAERWIHGGQPYMASSFQVTSGPGQPFLYPPFVLPVVAPFAALPEPAVTVAWAAICLVVATWTCDRLGLPAWAWPFVLAWPPYAQALLGLNVQVLLFAAFVALFYDRPRATPAPSEPPATPLREHDPELSSRPPLVDGALGVVVALLKTSQVHPWIYLLRTRPRAALLGAGAAVLLVAATLPLTGVRAWLDWLVQARHAAQPGLDVGGISLIHFLPFPLGIVVGAGTVLLLLAVPPRNAGAWVGLLTVVGSPDLHFFGLLFALPAMLTVRREIGLVAALAISFYETGGAWIGIGVVAIGLLLSRWRPALLEPASRPALPRALAGEQA
jgi:Glycosyltransferase family 87